MVPRAGSGSGISTGGLGVRAKEAAHLPTKAKKSVGIRLESVMSSIDENLSEIRSV
jgi:hypothetical protein